MRWPSTTIGQLCLPTEQRDPTGSPDKPFRYIDISAIDKDAKRITTAPEMLGAEAPSRARKAVRAGDVLVSTVRPNLNAVAVVPDELDGEIASTGFCVLRANPKLAEGKFIFYRCLTPEFVNSLVAQMRGANYPAVSDGVVKRAATPLPAAKEQKQILELLEQADGLRRQRAEADALADRILPALFLKMFGDPATNPKGWPTKSAGRAFKMVSGGTPSKAKAGFWNGSIPWVSPKDMKSVIITDTEDHITEDAIKNSATSVVPEGAAMMVVRSGILAHSVPVALAAKPMAINQDLKGMVPNPEEAEEIKPYYMLAWLLAAKQTLLGCVKRGATVHSIDSGKFQALPFMLPPPPLQDAFARQFKNLLALKAKQTEGGRDIERLFVTMLHRAFTGELTHEWRNAHMKELLAEMEQQARLLKSPLEE